MAVNVQDLQAQDDTYAKQVVDQQAAQKAQEAQAKEPPSFLQKWVTGPLGRVTTGVLDSAVSAADSIYDTPGMRKARDVTAGAITGATNIADAGMSAVKNAPTTGSPTIDLAKQAAQLTSPIWDHAKQHILDFRDAVAVQDPTLADSLTQGVAQLAVPFAGYSRGLSFVHGIANTVAAGAMTDATALAPHDGRMADLIALGKHTEGKLGDALRTLAPDGSALNAYINYLGDRGNESEAEGRFKNVLDGFGANLIATPLIHAAGMVLKQGTAGLRYAVENGVGSAGDMMPAPQRGAVGTDLTDMSKSPEDRALERENVAAQRARAEGVTPEVQPEPIPANAAAREGAVALRQKMDPATYSMEDTTPKGWGKADTTVTVPRMAIQANDDYLTDLGMKLAAVNEGAAPLKLHDVLSDLSQNLNPAEPAGAFYKELASRLADKNLDTSITSTKAALGNNKAFASPGPNTVGQYHLGSDEMGLHKGAFKNNIVMVHTVTHEAVHAATLDAIKDTSTGLRTQIESLRADAEKRWPTEYGVKNPQEFVAEAESNKSFQDKLKATTDASGQTLWDQYKTMIGGVLGLSGVALASPHWDDVLTVKEKNGA